MSEPPFDVAQGGERVEPRRRTGCLAVYLYFVLLVNVILVGYYLHQGLTGQAALQRVPAWQVVLRPLISLANLVFALAVLCRRRWGAVGYLAVPIVSVLVAIHFFEPSWFTSRGYVLWGPGPLVTLGGGVGAIALYVLAACHALGRPEWTRSDTLVLVCLGLGALLLGFLPGMAVWPFDLRAAEAPSAGLLGGLLLAILVRPVWGQMK